MMDPATLCGLAVVALLVLLAMGVPVAVAMGMVGLAGMWVVGGPGLALTQLQTLPYNLGADYAFAVVPLFVLMGNLAMAGGLAADLYDAAEKWLRHVRGGLYYTTIIASTAFGAASGSTVVNATVFTRLALPEMLRHGYSKHYSSACICSVGTLATMIPPSVAMVIYAIITEQSLGRLMIAGIIPGIFSGVLYLAMTRIFMRWKPQLAPQPGKKVALLERLIGLKGVWIVATLFLLLMGGIYLGLFSPSSAGAVGACGALLVVVGRRRLTGAAFLGSLRSTATITCILFAIIIGGLLFSRMLVSTGAINELIAAIPGGAKPAPWVVLTVTVVVYLILGCLVDSTSMIIVTLPFLFPMAQAAGLDPIWYGILVIQLVEISAITPPVGMNLFATVSAAQGQVTIEDVIRGITPFVVLSLVILGILIAFPQLALWLPNRMFNQ
jgi:tripartite ATP-independent transporter DctM subunit